MSNSHPISDILIAWYKKNKRDLPWRNTNDPYKIWLSEIMLQQTQVVQGLSYYLKFTEEFPKVTDLAKAPEDKVMQMWQGLGYYSRARNLHYTAKEITRTYKGKFPETYSDIRNLKGIGDYTAAAIASIAYNLPHAVVDGNVYRVLSRLFAIKTPINSTQGKKEFQELANEILNTKNAGLHNSAIMEFGALWCKPQNPNCETCPLQQQCLAYEKGLVTRLPVKENKIKIKNRYFNYFILNYNEKVYIQKRNKKDIWQNLYEFYLLESDIDASLVDLMKSTNFDVIFGKHNMRSEMKLPKHILSHQHLYSTFYEIELKNKINLDNFILVNRSQLNNFGLPQLIVKYLNLTEQKS